MNAITFCCLTLARIRLSAAREAAFGTAAIQRTPVLLRSGGVAYIEARAAWVTDELLATISEESRAITALERRLEAR